MPFVKPFPQALTTLFGTIEGHLKAGAPVFAGPPGSIALRKNQHGVQYYVRRYYVATAHGQPAAQKEEYLGLKDEVADLISELQRQINESKTILAEVRLLLRENFQKAATKDYATIATLHLNGLFAAGATLVGSHAYGTILNTLGFLAPAAYETEDIDVARNGTLAFADVKNKNFLEILRSTGIDFVPVPELDSRQPSTSFKQSGASRFHVDLLVPSRDSSQHNVPIPELGAHATALPYLAYLLRDTQMSALLAHEGCCPVRVPSPERFAIHKLLISQIRNATTAKSYKDVYQASAVIEALGQRFPGAIEHAIEELPTSACRHVLKTVPLVVGIVGEDSPGVEELREAIGRATSRGQKKKASFKPTADADAQDRKEK